jgi:hypothetical protein
LRLEVVDVLRKEAVEVPDMQERIDYIGDKRGGNVEIV